MDEEAAVLRPSNVFQLTNYPSNLTSSNYNPMEKELTFVLEEVMQQARFSASSPADDEKFEKIICEKNKEIDRKREIVMNIFENAYRNE